MEEHITHSMSEDLKLGDEDLEAVSGGKATNDRFIARGQIPVFKDMMNSTIIGLVKNGVVLWGVTSVNGTWYKVPVRLNFSKMQLLLPQNLIDKMMNSFVYILNGDLEPASK